MPGQKKGAPKAKKTAKGAKATAVAPKKRAMLDEHVQAFATEEDLRQRRPTACSSRRARPAIGWGHRGPKRRKLSEP